ncbi:hypothetical protein [Algicella marina]|uniref:Asp/Glu racemase n=1 Tax=Algicella marina TaxID=2683284 RepID=A0A6P1STC4_9RHOB|nr:hypothetical protein [Algicella marina]QHQ33678.1 hypothetical protein GO499_00050 [Algicella marina]
MRFACLHTSISSISIFEKAKPDGVELAHHVNADLLKRANVELSSAVLAETSAELAKLQNGVDAVLLTCSTLRPAAKPPAYAVDALLAERLAEVGMGRRVEVLFTNPGTKNQSTQLFTAIPGLASISMREIPNAWNAFLEGREADYHAAITQATDASDAELVVYAQASMAGATRNREGILSSPDVALQRLQAIMAQTQLSVSA